MLNPLSQSNPHESENSGSQGTHSGASQMMAYASLRQETEEVAGGAVPKTANRRGLSGHSRVSPGTAQREHRRSRYTLPNFLKTHKAERQRAKRRLLSRPFFLKLLDSFYWKRLLRYVYIRFLRMRGSSKAIARGIAAGVFAGSFPLLGFQTLIGVAIAAVFQGNKLAAAVGTWISNPFTYVPFFMLNFQVGRWLLRIPRTAMELPTSPNSLDAWMSLGASATAALLVGSCVVGLVLGVTSYLVSLRVAHRVRHTHRK